MQRPVLSAATSALVLAVAGCSTGGATPGASSAGTTLAGCHLPGHYAGGMKAEITVED